MKFIKQDVCLHSAELKAENDRVTAQSRSKRCEGISGVHMKTIIFVRLREVLLIFPAYMSEHTKYFHVLQFCYRELSSVFVLLGKGLAAFKKSNDRCLYITP